jgi:putative addiction module component (TIGR02574 family)
MSKRATQVLEEALSLPPGERAELIDRLLSSLDSPSRQRIDELWAQEAEDRLDAFERGEIKAISAKDVFDEIDKKKI